MDVRLLGPTVLRVGGRGVPLGPAKQRTVLAALLVDAGRPVSLDTLAARVWSQPPPAARSVLYAHIAQLRRRLVSVREETASAIALIRESGGYVLEIEPDAVDFHRFRRLVTAARAETDPGRALDRLRQAVDCWGGEPLADIPGDWAHGTRVAWEQQLLSAAVLWAARETRHGSPEAVLERLSCLLVDRPTDESIAAELMRAMLATGRRADALALYREVRGRLVEQLGLEPGPLLREFQAEALRDGPPIAATAFPAGAPVPVEPAPTRSALATSGASALVTPALVTPALVTPAPVTSEPAGPAAVGPAAATATPPVPVPAQLPADIADFTGRAAQLAWLTTNEAGSGGSTTVLVLTGTAGAGKTALAVRWAHANRDRFPDGQLYVNLRGFDPAGGPLHPVAVLGRFLCELGLPPSEVPSEMDEATAIFRSLSADRRMLVLLDNAMSAEQVRPLIPGGSGCLVLVTSRNRLAGLVARDGARDRVVEPMPPTEAADLLARVLGAERTAINPDATAELAELCAYLPLTLRIAAANVSSRADPDIGGYVRILRSGDLLAALAVDDDERSAASTAFDLSYQALDRETQWVLRALGMNPGPDFTAEITAALARLDGWHAERALRRLAAASLVHEHVPGRFVFHDLLRLYAMRRAAGEDTVDERDAAVERYARYYLYAADNAARLLYPQMFRLDLPEREPAAPVTEFASHQAAMAWLDAERAHFTALASLDTTAGSGINRIVWLLADTLRGYLGLRQYLPDWLAVAGAGLSAAMAADDLHGQAAAHHSLAQAVYATDHQRTIEHLRLAARLSDRAGWWDGHTAALCNLGIVYSEIGRLGAAEAQFVLALDRNRRAGRPGGIAVNLNNLGDVYRRMGALDRATEHLEAALTEYRRLGSPTGRATALVLLAGVRHDLGQLGRAADLLHEALALHRETRDRLGEAAALIELSEVVGATGEHRQGFEYAWQALRIATEFRDKRIIAHARNALARSLVGQGRYAVARDIYREALHTAREVQASYPEAWALLGLAETCLALRRVEEAREHADRARTLAERVGFAVLLERITALRADLDSGRPLVGRAPADPGRNRVLRAGSDATRG